MKILGLTGAVPQSARRFLTDPVASLTAETTETSEAGDELTLSAEAKGTRAAKISELLQQQLEPVKVEDVRRQYDQNFAGLQSRLQMLFYKNGIDTSQDIRLQTTADGQVVVAGDHPQKDKIEQLFADDPTLRNDFVQIDAQASFLKAADEAMAFQKAYAENPAAALERFSYLFEPDYKPKFTLAISGEAFEGTFDR